MPDDSRHDTAHQRAHAMLDKVLALARKERTTGTGGVSLVFSDGGVRDVYMEYKERDKADQRGG